MSAPNYARPDFPGETNFKKTKLDRIADKKKAMRDAEEQKIDVYKVVDQRDEFRCVICGRKGNPYATTLLGRLHHCHVKDASLGGELVTSNIFLGCSECHLLRIHGKQIRVIDEHANADEGLEFEIDEAAVVHTFGNRAIPQHVHIVLPSGERQIR